MSRYWFSEHCIEICGDGINLGQVECDDGNNLNGDGCSSDCRIEQGFMCRRRDGGLPDLCIDVLPPKAVANMKKGNVLEIKFTEPVTSLVERMIYFSYTVT